MSESAPRRWGRIDGRSLAAFRITFGATLLVDLLVRWPVVGEFYSNGGWLSNHYALFSKPGAPQLSALFGLSSETAVHAFFLLTMGLVLAFIAGYRTRVVHPLMFLAVLSVHTRNHMVIYGFDLVTSTVGVWALFLPLESRWSVDARRGMARSSSSVSPIAALGIVAQIALIYFYNGLHKDGTTWRAGEAVHYLFWQDAIARAPAVFARTHLPATLTWLATHATLVIEVGGALLLLSPWRRSLCRSIAVVGLVALHAGIWFGVNVGLFSIIMISTYPLLASERFWLALSRRLHRWPGVAEALARPDPAAPEAASDYPRLRRSLSLGSELLVASWAAICVVAALTAAPVVDPDRRPDLPAWLSHASAATLTTQNWALFAPEAPTEEGLFVVEARTIDGRVVDPYRGGAPLTDIPEAYGAWLAQEWVSHSVRMRHGYFESMRTEFERRVWRYHEITGNPQDLIVAYEAYNYSRPSPPLGERRAPPTKKNLIATGRRPGL